MTKRNCSVGVCSSPEHCDEIAGCFSDPTAAVMRKALFFAKQRLYSGIKPMSKDLDLDDVAATSPKAAQELQALRQQLTKALAACKTKGELIEKFRRAIGDHCAPNDCYATGPLTGNEYLDLVQCPACSALAAYEEALDGPVPNLKPEDDCGIRYIE